MFVPSGTMANQIGVGVNTQPGDELLCSATSHVYVWEAGGIARLSGVTARTFEGDGGILRLDDISDAIRPMHDAHYVRTRLVCLENTHNRGGGRVHSLESIAEIPPLGSRAQPGHASRRCPTHERGRGLGSCRPAKWAQHFDTVSICFSKGLGGTGRLGPGRLGRRDSPRTAAAEALRRRECGRLASSPLRALYALENHVDRLSEDHAHARLLADAFAATEGFALESGPVETNLVWVAVDPSVGTAAEVAAYLRSRDILVSVLGAQVIRACTHLDVTARRGRICRRRDPRDRAGHDLGDDAGLLERPNAIRMFQEHQDEPEPRTAPRCQCGARHGASGRRAVPDQLPDPVSRAGVHPVVGKHVIFLTFFTNIVLMACFLGVSVGCLASARRFSWMNAFIPLAHLCGGFGLRLSFGSTSGSVGSWSTSARSSRRR